MPFQGVFGADGEEQGDYFCSLNGIARWPLRLTFGSRGEALSGRRRVRSNLAVTHWM